MTARSTRRTFTLGAVAATAGALALALIPASAADAVTATPVFSYIDVSGGTAADPIRQLSVDDVFGTSLASTRTESPLTATGVQTYTYDVSADGQTLVVAARTGAPTTDPYDSTYGMVVIHDDGVNPRTSKLLGQFWDANPVLSGDGATAWWIDGSTLYSAVTATGAVTAHGVAFGPKGTTETLDRLAVSADGTAAAVLYRGVGTNTTDRVLAATIADGKTTDKYAEVLYPKATPYIRPASASFVFLKDNATLVYSFGDVAAPADLKSASVTIPAATPHVTAATPRPTLDNFYDLRLAADGTTWWTWKDAVVNTVNQSTAYSIDNAVLLTGTPVAQASDRGNGNSTFRYTPSTVAPPVLDNSTDNRAQIFPTFGFTATTAKYGAKLAYQSIGLYGGLPGGGYSSARPAETDRAVIEKSIDGGKTWSTYTTTSGANVFAIGTKWYNGYSPVLARNTWFRWRSFSGDAFTKPFSTSVRKIIVVPTVTVKIAVSGSYRTVYGTATRKGGTAVLQRYYSGLGWRSVATKVMASTTSFAAFNFGKRALAKGTYRVVTVADASWGAGTKGFTV